MKRFVWRSDTNCGFFVVKPGIRFTAQQLIKTNPIPVAHNPLVITSGLETDGTDFFFVLIPVFS